jgi:hypothetical protein
MKGEIINGKMCVKELMATTFEDSQACFVRLDESIWLLI